MKFEWEMLEGGDYDGTKRAKVMGGWIIRNIECDTEGLAIAMVFIPDPEHKWEVLND